VLIIGEQSKYANRALRGRRRKAETPPRRRRALADEVWCCSSLGPITVLGAALYLVFKKKEWL